MRNSATPDKGPQGLWPIMSASSAFPYASGMFHHSPLYWLKILLL